MASFEGDEERPLCPTCGAYWDCGHPHGEWHGLPVYINEKQEEPVRIEYTGPPLRDKRFMRAVKAVCEELKRMHNTLSSPY